MDTSKRCITNAVNTLSLRHEGAFFFFFLKRTVSVAESGRVSVEPEVRECRACSGMKEGHVRP